MFNLCFLKKKAGELGIEIANETKKYNIDASVSLQEMFLRDEGSKKISREDGFKKLEMQYLHTHFLRSDYKRIKQQLIDSKT